MTPSDGVGTERLVATADSGTFGQRLRQARERAGLSQVALAGEDLHPSYVSLLESGRRSPTAAAVSVLAARLGIDPEELVSGVLDRLGEQVVLAEAAIAMGHPADAVRLLEPHVGSASPDRLVSDPLAFRAGEALATGFERTNQTEKSVELLERLRTAAESAPGRLPWLPVTMALVRCYRDAGDVSRAIDLGEAALTRCRELRLSGLAGHAALVSTLAGAYSDRGDHLRAKVVLDELVAEVEQGDSDDDRAYAYWNAALNAADRGHPGDGIRLAQQAAALLALGEDHRSQARIEITRAWLLLAQQPPAAEEARRILRAVLPRAREQAGTLSVVSVENDLARCELLLGRPEVAARHARSSLKRLGESGERLTRARALTALGAALVAMGETAAGVHELESAAAALEAYDAPRQAAAVWRQLSDVYRALGDAPAALAAADRALEGSGIPHQPVVQVPTEPLVGRGRSARRPARA
jgi:transcriptional regulator with XRE-family HTH domain